MNNRLKSLFRFSLTAVAIALFVSSVSEPAAASTHCALIPPGPGRDRCMRNAFIRSTIEQAAARASRQQAILAAMAYIDCIKSGGDPADCFGEPPKLEPFPPPPPFISALRTLSPNERAALHKHLSETARMRHEAEQSFLEEAFKAADMEKTGKEP